MLILSKILLSVSSVEISANIKELKLGTYHTSDISAQVIHLQRYDVILGKPWLYHANPSVDWRTNTLTFRYGPKTIVVPADTRNKIDPSCHSIFISRQQLAKIPAKDELFAVCLADTTNETFFSHDTSEVKTLLQEYSEVFPENLPEKLPPKRNVDHAIDLIPGSEPPSRPIYRMSFDEMNELKKQLADLLKKGFIRPTADALSRLSHLTNISSVSVQFDNEVNWEQAYSNDSYFSHIWNTLNKNNLEN
ncbi:11997_t:CDS:2 [Entrophospora sp. SA101]|nr:11997_t:CDS:2 [Entrophospora sp. SA101]